MLSSQAEAIFCRLATAIPCDVSGIASKSAFAAKAFNVVGVVLAKSKRGQLEARAIISAQFAHNLGTILASKKGTAST